jgi:hypothetical protein
MENIYCHLGGSNYGTYWFKKYVWYIAPFCFRQYTTHCYLIVCSVQTTVIQTAMLYRTAVV